MRRDRNRKVSGALRLITYIMIIHTHTYMHRTGENPWREGGVGRQGEANTLRSPSRRPPNPIAWVRGFVAPKPETVNGGRLEQARTEEDVRKRMYRRGRRRHVHDHATSRKPPDVTNLSHSGGLRAIVRGKGGSGQHARRGGGPWVTPLGRQRS